MTKSNVSSTASHATPTALLCSVQCAPPAFVLRCLQQQTQMLMPAAACSTVQMWPKNTACVLRRPWIIEGIGPQPTLQPYASCLNDSTKLRLPAPCHEGLAHHYTTLRPRFALTQHCILILCSHPRQLSAMAACRQLSHSTACCARPTMSRQKHTHVACLDPAS